MQTEAQWNEAHAAYLAQAKIDRVTYRALQVDAAERHGMSKAEFNKACRAEIDEDLAGDSSKEWVRAGREVLWRAAAESIEWDSYEGPNEAELWAREIWNRACDSALDTRWY